MTKGRGQKTNHPVEGDAFKFLQRPQELFKLCYERMILGYFIALQIVIGLGEGRACEESKEN